jgi:hypothetical protein
VDGSVDPAANGDGVFRKERILMGREFSSNYSGWVVGKAGFAALAIAY